MTEKLNNLVSENLQLQQEQVKPKEIELLIEENDKLKQMIIEQRDQIIQAKQKEEKFLKLLYLIHKNGINIEQMLLELENEEQQNTAQQTQPQEPATSNDGTTPDVATKPLMK